MLYHLVPQEFLGVSLLPLSRLRVEQPQLYERHLRKYEGREALLNDHIPGLDCCWQDVIFLTAIPPRAIRELHEQAGFEMPRLRWFEIDLTTLERDRLAVYWYRYSDRERKYEADNWGTFSPALLPELRKIPAATRQHYRESAVNGKWPFAFFRTPHILYRGALDATRLRIVNGSPVSTSAVRRNTP